LGSKLTLQSEKENCFVNLNNVRNDNIS
jgi:hypothetical protein